MQPGRKKGFALEDHIELITVLLELHQVSGLRLSMHDVSFREMAAWPAEKCAFCAELQRNPTALAKCLQSDREAFAAAQSSDRLYRYRCAFGLDEVVAPVYSFGKLIGYLMMGQTLCRPAGNREAVRRAAMPYAVDPAALARALDDMALRDPEQMLSCARIMDICAKYISLSNRFNPEKAELAPAIRAYIYAHYAEPLSINQLKTHFFCSRATLINAYRSRYGESINGCITRVRLEHARERLVYSRSTIKEIASACGFSNQNYFSKVFLKETQKTPTQFRREAWAKEEQNHAAEKCQNPE